MLKSGIAMKRIQRQAHPCDLKLKTKGAEEMKKITIFLLAALLTLRTASLNRSRMKR